MASIRFGFSPLTGKPSSTKATFNRLVYHVAPPSSPPHPTCMYCTQKFKTIAESQGDAPTLNLSSGAKACFFDDTAALRASFSAAGQVNTLRATPFCRLPAESPRRGRPLLWTPITPRRARPLRLSGHRIHIAGPRSLEGTRSTTNRSERYTSLNRAGRGTAAKPPLALRALRRCRR